MKIGITIDSKHIGSLWVNGLHLNVLFFLKLLKRSAKQHEVCLLTLEQNAVPTIPDHLKGIDICWVEEKFRDLDLIIVMGSELQTKTMQEFKSLPNKRIISYRCGNSYILAAEKILFKPNTTTWFTHTDLYDEIWYVPQQHEDNHGYFKTIHRTNAIPIPFVWHNEFLIRAAASVNHGHKQGKYKKDFAYNPNKEKKVIGVMEPNQNIIKYCMLPAMIAEESYRGEVGKRKIEKLILANSSRLGKDKTFLSILKTFDLFKDKKVTAEDRYQTAFILTQYIDILVSHQLHNPLNYLYMDAAYLGYPVLHNAWMCKDVGYYYEGSDTVEASKKLDWILDNHDTNRKEYAQQNGKALYRFSIENPILGTIYDELLENLFTKGGNGDKAYDSNTNLYK